MIISLFASLYEKSLLSFSDQQWTEVLNNAIRYDVAPQLYYLIKRNGDHLQIPSYVMEGLKMKAISVALQNSLIKEENKRIIASLVERAVPVIALKGTGFAEKYYGHHGARRTGDIDLLVPESAFRQAEDVLLSMGYRLTDKYFSLHYHVEYTKWHMNIPLQVELHKSLVRRHRSDIQINRLWDESEFIREGSSEKQFTLQQTFYTICLHSSKHGMMRYRHLLDVAHLIYTYGDQIDYMKVFKTAKNDGTFRMVLGALSATYRMFPGLRKLKPLPVSTPRIPWFSEKVIINFEQNKMGWEKLTHYLLYPVITSEGLKSILLQIRYAIFPQRDQMERLMNVNRKMPIIVLYLRLYSRKFKGFINQLSRG